MLDYGTVQSTTQPQPLVIDNYSVWVNSTIRAVTLSDDTPGWEYEQIQYPKDEYIKLISDKNASLDEQVLNLQMAVYEMITGQTGGQTQ